MTTQNVENGIAWEASEYAHNEKSIGWYAIYVLILSVVTGVTFWLTGGDWISLVVVTIMAVTLLIFANRKPRTIQYQVSDEGITIDGRLYPYKSFKSFSLMRMGATESLYLEPLERFMPSISVYFADEDGEQIIDILGSYLPHRDREPDLVDRVVHRIRL